MRPHRESVSVGQPAKYAFADLDFERSQGPQWIQGLVQVILRQIHRIGTTVDVQ